MYPFAIHFPFVRGVYLDTDVVHEFRKQVYRPFGGTCVPFDLFPVLLELCPFQMSFMYRPFPVPCQLCEPFLPKVPFVLVGVGVTLQFDFSVLCFPTWPSKGPAWFYVSCFLSDGLPQLRRGCLPTRSHWLCRLFLHPDW